MIPEPTVLVFTGSREHPNPYVATTALTRFVLNDAPGVVIVRHGACPGAQSIDQAIKEWIDDCGEALGVIADPMPADWDHCGSGCPAPTTPGHRRRKKTGDTAHPGILSDYCPNAGPRRNLAMLTKKQRPSLVIAAPYGQSYGTRNCINLAYTARIPTLVLDETGTATPAVLMEALF